MLPPAATGSGESLFVTARSACVITPVVAVAVLLAVFGSFVALAAVAVLVMVAPLATLLLSLTTMVKVAVSALATVALEKTTLPVPPTGGVVAVQPAGAVAETKVVLAGTASVTVALLAEPGPLLVRLTA